MDRISKKTVSSKDVDEARRQLRNRSDSFEFRKTGYVDAFTAQVEGRHFHLMLTTFNGFCNDLLLLSQGHWRITHDWRTSLATLAQYVEREHQFRTALDGVRTRAEVLEQSRFMYASLLAPLVCMGLAGSFSRLKEFSENVDESLFYRPEDVLRAQRPEAKFILSVVRLLRDEAPLEMEALDDARSMRESRTAGYELLLAAVADSDAHAVHTELENVESVFLSRRKSREPGLNAWGYGKLAQLVTFDVLGVFLARLARARGVKIVRDTPVHPAEFINVPL